MITVIFLWIAIATLAWLVGVLHARVRQLEKNQLRSHTQTNERIRELARASADSHTSLRRLSLAIADYVLPPEFRNKLPPT